MENFLNDAWACLSEAYCKLELAKKAQEEDNTAGEELDRTKEQFVERIGKLTGRVCSIQCEIMNIIYEHNNQ